MEWNAQQLKAIDKVGRWLKAKDQKVFTIAGYAGTGKTTLAKHLASSVRGPVYFATFTGKAAHVLKKKGIPEPSTLHKLMYIPKDKLKKKLKELESEKLELMTQRPLPSKLIKRIELEIQKEKEQLAQPSFSLNMESPLKTAALLVIDECYMVGSKIGEDLMEFPCPILALGDPGQLPPVNDKPYFGQRPDFILTDIQRQAKDNPIIQLASDIREGKILKCGSYGESRVVSRENADLRDIILEYDQLLVGKNVTRRNSNKRIRSLLGRDDWRPEEDDKLVCLRNNPDNSLLNGQLWRVMETPIIPVGERTFYVNLEEEDTKERENVFSHTAHFEGTELDYWEKRDANEFDYGYALTVHKAQGSQWDSVILMDEWFSSNRKQWLYTGVTRAAEKIIIVKM